MILSKSDEVIVATALFKQYYKDISLTIVLCYLPMLYVITSRVCRFDKKMGFLQKAKLCPAVLEMGFHNGFIMKLVL